MYSGCCSCCYCYFLVLLYKYYFLPLQQRWLLANTLLYIIWKVMIHHGCSIKVFRETPVSWLITSGYCRVFFRMSDIKSLWLTDPLGQDGRSGGCTALWTVSSSSSLMSWVALTASPGHGMYTYFLNNYYYCWWRYPFMNTASSSAYSNFAENRKWTKRKAQQRQHIHIVWVPERCL